MENITEKRYENGRPKLRRFQQAKWDEAVIFELSTPGARGVLVPEVEAELAAQVGDVVGSLPEGVARKTQPALPEMSQPEVLRHYLRLSQETLGVDFNVDIGQGTCTMKYSPKIHEQFVAMPQVAALHPLQDERPRSTERLPWSARIMPSAASPNATRSSRPTVRIRLMLLVPRPQGSRWSLCTPTRTATPTPKR
jgi:hypothetical protein